MNSLGDPYLSCKIAFYQMSEQALTGIQFDQEKAVKLLEQIREQMKKIEDEVEPKLPARKLKKSEEKEYTIPLKPFKKDGTLSAVMLKWLEKHQIEFVDIPDDLSGFSILWKDGDYYKVVGGKQLPVQMPMKLANQEDLKEWLMSEGWEPTLWNYKRGPNGKPLRDKKTGEYIKTSPKMQENGKLCPNLEEMSGELVRRVVEWLSLRNRLGVIEGWLEDPRLAFDGRLSAGATGITPTFRQRHTRVVNVPKAEKGVRLGKEMRELFCARPGYMLVGYDASALENRMEAHYTYKYPGGPEYAEEILNGDPHKKNAFVFYSEQIAEKGLRFDEVDKDTPELEPFRSKSKNGKYCLTYGGQPKRLAKTLGLPEWQGEQLYEDFWNDNEPLKCLKEAVTKFWRENGKKWIKGIDGRKIFTRSEHALVNSLFQSCGAIVMDYANIFMARSLGGSTIDDHGSPCFNYKGHDIYRVGYFHDECLWEVPEGTVEGEIGMLGVRSIEQAGKYLKLRVPLTASYAAGRSWADVH